MQAYLFEIDRLEHLNQRYGGYRYVAWKQSEKFSWELAAKYVKSMAAFNTKDRVLNASPTSSWRCVECRAKIRNVALLKRCPECGKLGSLRAVRR